METGRDRKATELRADARRNRDQIVAAAQELFLEEGVDVALEEVARRAGVGIGTLYRRFPDRDALLHAVGEHTLRRLADLAETAWREEPDAWHALCRFLRSCTEVRLGELSSKLDPRLLPALRTGQDLHELRQRTVVLVLRMAEEARASGHLRADVGPGDLALLMTLHVYTPPGADSGEAMRRVVEIMLNGLRAGSGTPLPGRLLTGEDLNRYTAVETPEEPGEAKKPDAEG